MTVTSATENEAAKAELAEVPDVRQNGTSKSFSRRIIDGAAWSIAGRLGSMGSLFVANVILARSLDTADYSAFLAASSLIPFLATLASLGTPYTIIRAVRWHETGSNDLSGVLKGAIQLTLAGCVVTAVGFLLASRVFPDEAKWKAFQHLPWMIVPWFSFSALCIVYASFLQGIDDFRLAALIGARSGGLAPNLIALACIAAATLLGSISLAASLGFQLIGYLGALAIAVVAVPLIIKRCETTSSNAANGASDSVNYNASWYFRESWPNLLNQLIGIALVELDLFWVTCLAGEETVAAYGVVRNLRLLVTAPLLVGTVSLAPFVAELFSKGNLSGLERLLRGTATMFAIPSLAVLAGMLLFPELIIRLTFGQAFTEASLALSIASIGCIFFVLSGSNGLTLTMTGRHRDLLVCGAIGLLVYIAISPWLVANYGVTGAAVAFTVQTIVVNALATLQVHRTIGVWTIPLLSWTTVRDEAAFLLRRGVTSRRE